MEQQRNVTYARKCVRHSLSLGEAPFASHLLYTQDGVLDDANHKQRWQGILAGLEWGVCANATVVYADYGFSDGMRLGIERAYEAGRTVEYRNIEKPAPLRGRAHCLNATI